VTEIRALLQHFLAALAYRTQKALRDAPDSFADFRAGPTSRTPKELVWQSENFIFARVRADNVTANQPAPEAPDQWWRPEEGHLPPGTHASKLADDVRESDRQ